MTRRVTTSLGAARATALLAVAVPTAAHAQSGPTAGAAGVEATVSMDNCQIKRSRNAGGFTYFRNRSVSQVRSSLRVTLSDPQALNIVDGTATAAPANS